MIALVNNFGVDTTAAYGAALQLWNYIQMPAFAVGMAVSAMAAQNVGARKWDRVNSIARVGVVFSVVLTGSMVLVIELLDTHAFQLFLPAGSEALRQASHLNHVVTWSFVFFGFSMVLFGVVRATGAVMAPLFVLTIALLVVRIPLAAALIGRYQVDAVWWSFPISSALAAVLAVLYYKYGGWRSARMAGGPTRGVVAPES
jgi:Na+-driven multidrug efflux pump